MASQLIGVMHASRDGESSSIRAAGAASIMAAAGVSMAGADLHDVQLAGADLRGAILCGANLTGAMLAGARLHKATLDHACLEGASLEGAVNGLMLLDHTHQLQHAAANPRASPDGHQGPQLGCGQHCFQPRWKYTGNW